jgi:hypothetical protein
VEVNSLDEGRLMRCTCGCVIFEVRWLTRVRPGRTHAHHVDPRKVYSCTVCGLTVAAKQAIDRKETA